VELALEGSLVAQRYVLTRKIGCGGMGSVWLAHDKSLDRICAIKLLDPDKLRDREVLARFAREARTTAQIRSVNVVEVFEHGIWDGVPFIVMEFLEVKIWAQRSIVREKLRLQGPFDRCPGGARARASTRRASSTAT
jgi:serine/threonine protein kinase